MLGLIEVTWCPNPLRPVADRQVRRLLATGSDTVDSVTRRLGLHVTPLVAVLNGNEVSRRRWRRKRVRPGDVLVLVQRARGVETAFMAAQIFGTINAFTLAATAALTFITSDFVISLAISVLANSLAGGRGNQQAGENKAPAAAYGIEGGANSLRPYQPLSLVLGEHRYFPDYASRPFSEYVVDETTANDVINATPDIEAQAVPAFTTSGPVADPVVSAPWTLLTSTASFNFYGDNAARTYQYKTAWSSEVLTAEHPHTFVVRYDATGVEALQLTDYESYLQMGDESTPPNQNWRPMAETLPVIVRYGYTAYDNTERLTSIFNWGLGDLEVSDLRIGSTPIEQFNQWARHDSVTPAGQGDRTTLTGYTSPGWVGNAYPGNVQVVDAGKLEQRAGVPNDGWVERQGSEGCRYIQIDIAGRLFKQAGGGIEALGCTMEAEYMAVGSSSWMAMPFSPFEVVNGSTTPVRNTYSAMLEVDVLKVRVRRTTAEPSDAAEVSELECPRIKFFRNTDALYPAQRRTGLMIKASGQLNGRIDRLSGLVRARMWRWASTAPWTDGLYPGDGAGPWSWGTTTNPAWLFLYYARGGFLNTSAAPGYLGQQGWLDQPDPGNSARLFGAGLTNDRIDYAAIVNWAHYCDAAGLQCHLVIDGQRSAGDVLDDIAAAGRASKTWATGKLSVWWEAAGQPVVAAFGMSNIVAGSFSVAYDTDTTVDEYALEFTRSDADYEPDTVYAAVPGVAQVVSQRTERAVYSMSRDQAQRTVNLLAASRYYHRRKIVWESHLEALAVQRGDIVHLAHDLTQWAFSGRLLELVATADQITQVRLSCQVENPGGGTFYLWVRQPGGTYMSIACVSPAQRTDTLQVSGAWAVADAPGVLTPNGAVQNLASQWPDTIPEDWMMLAGPTATPGKRARIVGMEPINQRRVRITARDEDEAYYPLENGLGSVPELASGERLVARVFNLAMHPMDAGGWRLNWELENAHGAEVMLGVNGNPAAQVPIQGHMTVAGTELLLPAYAAGTQLAIQVLPVAAGTPVAVQGDSLTVTV